MPPLLRIILIEDSEQDAAEILQRIHDGGYETEVRQITQEEEMIRALEEGAWDLVIAEYMVPGFSSFNVLRLLKERELDTPLIIVSGSLNEAIAVQAMQEGATDYIYKDNLMRLLPAVEREVRDANIRKEKRSAEQALSLTEAKYRDLYQWERNAREVLQKLRQSDDLGDIFRVLVQEVGHVLKVDRCFILQFNGLLSRPVAYEYRSAEDHPSIRGHLFDVAHAPLFNQCLQNETVYVRDVGDPEVSLSKVWQTFFGEFQVRGLLALPIHYRETLLAILVATCREPRSWDEQEQYFLNIVTEQVAINLYQARIIEELERTTQIKDHFLASVTHELRTPLNVIIGYGEMLLSHAGETLTEKQRKYVDNIAQSGKQLLGVVNSILDMSRFESGVVRLEYEIFDPEDVLEEVLAALHRQAEQKGITVSVEIDPALNTMEADRLRLKQILFNLISNAIKFNKAKGTVRIRVALETMAVVSDSKDPRVVRFSIQDSGIGIPEKEVRMLFSTFHQVDRSLARKQEGTGLGLALSRHLVSLHGGEIFVNSRPGEGSTFSFILPLRRSGRRLDTEEGLSLAVQPSEES
jgi:signal transduction histidine kinase/DNA-binding response OmpR family regulator